ncbi:MAG: TSUP family transporter [Candidatus Lokiarchaeota archaeon]|nr:TSUP family transporter [Candidatus Lokiarchaeota archaeon]
MNSILLFIVIVILGFLAAFSDTSLGMGYSLLTPILMLIGYQAIVVVPILLLAQMCIGFTGTIFHHLYGNIDLSSKEKDVKITILFSLTGMTGMLIAVIVAINVPAIVLSIYIGAILFAAGILMMVKLKFEFTWAKLYVLSALGAFNKAMSGGGYGPITTSGQIMSDRKVKKSIAVTSFSEAFLSGFGFLLYFIFNNFQLVEVQLMIIMVISGVIATPLGALLAKKLNKKRARIVIGFASISLGIITVIRLFIVL